MVFCSQCGSSSRDVHGFCRGCGAPVSSGEPATPGLSAMPQPQSESFLRQSLAPAIFPVDPLTRKNIRLALVLTALFGPLGMVYTTWKGAIVMSVVYVLLRVYLGPLVSLVVWPVCMFWTVMAAMD